MTGRGVGVGRWGIAGVGAEISLCRNRSILPTPNPQPVQGSHVPCQPWMQPFSTDVTYNW